MNLFFFLVLQIVGKILNYDDTIDILDKVQTKSSLLNIIKRVKKSNYYHILYSIYINDPYVLVPYFSKSVIEKNVLCKIVGLKIHNTAIFCFYKICNGSLDINFINLILKTKIKKGRIGGIGDFIIIKAAQFIRKSLIICLLEPFIFKQYENDIKAIYKPETGFTEIYKDNNLSFADEKDIFDTNFGCLENIGVRSKYIPISDLSITNKHNVLAYKIYLMETMRFGVYTDEYLRVSNISAKNLIYAFNKNKSLVNTI